MRILVVCAGNTCRSPAGEAAIRSAAARAGIAVDVSSAGTSATHVGEPPTPAMVRAGRARGLDIAGEASQVTAEDLAAADLVLALDTRVVLFLRSMAPTAPIELLGTHDPSGSEADIADPYGGDDSVYAATVDRIIRAADSLVASLRD